MPSFVFCVQTDKGSGFVQIEAPDLTQARMKIIAALRIATGEHDVEERFALLSEGVSA